MQHTHEQHMVETSQMRSHIQQLEAQAGDQSRVQRLAEVQTCNFIEILDFKIFYLLFDV